MDQTKTALADDDKSYKYQTNRQTEDTESNDSETDSTDIPTNEIVTESIKDFVTDSLWAGTLRPSEVPETTSPKRQNNPEYRDDMLYMTEDTTVSEAVDFMRRCIENPIRIGDKVVWNFSTHTIDDDAIKKVKSKNQDRFVVPYQVTGAWGFMFSLLPEEVRTSEILVYNPSDEEYVAYRSLHRTTPSERIEQIRQDFARRVVSESGDLLELKE